MKSRGTKETTSQNSFLRKGGRMNLLEKSTGKAEVSFWPSHRHPTILILAALRHLPRRAARSLQPRPYLIASGAGHMPAWRARAVAEAIINPTQRDLI